MFKYVSQNRFLTTLTFKEGDKEISYPIPSFGLIELEKDIPEKDLPVGILKITSGAKPAEPQVEPKTEEPANEDEVTTETEGE